MLDLQGADDERAFAVSSQTATASPIAIGVYERAELVIAATYCSASNMLPQSLHWLFRRLCSQKLLPPLSLQLFLCRLLLLRCQISFEVQIEVL